ncbi:MAG: hypothetical protein K2N18_04170, partial [Clostridia bacterium]|nr:hypothetical protein [Clostridia bacterium]
KLDSFTVTGSNDVAENYNLLNPEVTCSLVINRRQIQIQVVLEDGKYSIELDEEVPTEDFEDVSGSEFGFAADDLSNITAVYSYVYLGADGNSASTSVDREDVNKTIGIYEISVEFKEATVNGNVLGNYRITENLSAELEVTARKVTVEPMYNGADRAYNGEALKESDFTFRHWHGDNESELGFDESFVPEYEFLFDNGKVQSTDFPVNAGTYTVTINFKNINPNVYTLTYSDTVLTVTIFKRTLVATVNYDASQYADLTYSFDLLPTSSISISDTDENGDTGILDCDKGEDGVYIDWYFYNDVMNTDVVYNYAGTDEIIFTLEGDANGNYQLQTENSGVTFTVKKAPLYVTPNS